MHYFQFEIKEWLSNTAHLSLEEEAAYLRLIFFYYDSERPLPHDDLPMVFRKCRVPENLGKEIMLEFFRMDGHLGAWVHDRCEKEIAKYRAKHEQATRAGKASAERRLNARSTDVQPIINHESSIINHQSNTKKPRATAVATPEGVNESVWNDFVALRKSKKAAITNTAIAGLQREANKAGMTMEQVLRTCCERGWVGFKSDWMIGQAIRINPHDVAHVTVPAAPNQDAALRKIEQDAKNAVPIPANIKAKMAELLKGRS
jgi:uncharacterized protein YdaU (DUF1376 family)